MSLDNFRTQHLVWDKAHAHIHKVMSANAGDSNGRKLRVQIVNGGVVEDLTGATLSLSWQTKDGANYGLDAFSVVDATKGEYEIFYTTEMLSNEGVLRASLVLVDSVGRVESNPFGVTVWKSNVDDGAVQGVNSFTALTQALVNVNAFDQKIEAYKSETDAQLAEKAKKEEVYLKTNGININDLDEPTRQAFLDAQGVDVNYVLGVGNVKPANTTFFKTGKNLFNKNTVKTGYYLSATGAEIASSTFVISDFVPVEANTNYFVSHSYYNIVFYDANRNVISSTTGEANKLFTTPENARFLRFAIYYSYVDVTQLEKGDVGTAHEMYSLQIGEEYVEKRVLSESEIPPLTLGKLEFAQKKSNLFDKSLAEINKTLSLSTGNTSTANNFVVSGLIPVEPNSSYIIKSARTYVVFNGNMAVVGAKPNTVATNNIVVATPSDATYLKISWYLPDTHLVSLDTQQVNKGEVLLPFEPYGYVIPESVLPKSITASIQDIKITLPPKIYALVGQETNIYFDNIINGKDTDFDFDVTCSVGQQLEDRFRLIPESAGIYSMSIKVLKNGTELKTATASVVISALSSGSGVDKSLLVIGDSTTEQLGGAVIQKLTHNFSGDSMNITTIGTRGTSPNFHEGKSGWTTALHFKDDDSAFVFDGAFDFAQYMSINSYDSVDYVVFNLGINDVFSILDDNVLNTKANEMIDQYETMIADIKTYDNNIKIGVAVTIPPNYSQEAFGLAYNNGQNLARYKRNNILLVEKIISKFKDRETDGVYLIPLNTNLDTRHNMGSKQEKVNARNETLVTRQVSNGGVHPAESGYWQIADVYWYWLKSFEI